MTTESIPCARGKCVDFDNEGDRSQRSTPRVQYNEKKLPEPSKGSCSPRERLDRWGFTTSEDNYQQSTLDSEWELHKVRKENERLEKWLKMKDNWNEESEKRIKRRCRKGIPDAMRGIMWMLISGAEELKLANPGVYRKHRHEQPDTEALAIIGRDLERTFPSHDFFKRQNKQGQTSLKSVLIAYACYDREIGYCQGMGFIATLFLMYCTEEDAFWLLVAVLRDEGNYKMRGNFANDLHLTQQRCFQMDQLVKRHIPQLHEHFQEQNVIPFFYCSKWFLTVFTYNFPFEAVVRIWDVFLNEGIKIIFRIGLQCLKNEEERLLEVSGGQLFSTCTSLHTRVNPDTLIEQAMKLKLTRAQIQITEDEYKKSQNEIDGLRI